MKNYVLPTVLLIIGLFPKNSEKIYAQHNDRFVSIEELASQKRVKALFKGKGSYSGDCVALTVENLTTDTAYVWIESGRRLDNPDENAQDILIVKEQKITVPPREKFAGSIYGFCCQATNHCPAKDTEFNIGSMADVNLQWIAKFINKNTYDVHTVQQAVWVFSNNNNPASIIASKDKQIQNLRKAIAEKLNIILPWYDVYYKEETGQVFSNKHTRITGNLSFYSNTNGFVHINIRKENGLLMTKLVDEIGVYAKAYTYAMDVNIENWDKGKYYVNVYIDNNLKQRQEFIL